LLFCFTRLPPRSFGCRCAMVGILLRSPRGDAAAPPAFSPWPRWLASFHSCLPVPPASAPSAADRSRHRMVPELRSESHCAIPRREPLRVSFSQRSASRRQDVRGSIHLFQARVFVSKSKSSRLAFNAAVPKYPSMPGRTPSAGNIHRHSGSKTAAVRISKDSEQILVAAEDSGGGIPSDKLSLIRSGRSGIGFRGMAERIRYLAGNLEIRSTNGGTTVTATLPL
jgi:hypothetical protein